jgi:multiple sugar transport system permease protein
MKTPLVWKIVTYIGLAVLVLWAVAPFYWMIITSFKANKEMYVPVPSLWPSRFILDHYREVLKARGFPMMFRNSVVIATITTSASIVFGGLAAYALARLHFRGRRLAGLSIILTYVVPTSVLFIPLFRLLRSLSLTNTLPGLILADLTSTVPFCTWVLIGYLRDMPKELEDAALIDGCGRVGALVRIVVPLAAPAVVAVALYSMTRAWNEFLYAVVFTTSKSVMPLTAGLANMSSEDVFFWGPMMAMSVLMAVPPVLVYFLAQRWVVGGLVLGGVKG